MCGQLRVLHLLELLLALGPAGGGLGVLHEAEHHGLAATHHRVAGGHWAPQLGSSVRIGVGMVSRNMFCPMLPRMFIVV